MSVKGLVKQGLLDHVQENTKGTVQFQDFHNTEVMTCRDQRGHSLRRQLGRACMAG